MNRFTILACASVFSDRDDEAYDSFYKATWNQAWAAASHHALAEIDCSRKNWAAALEHLNRSLRFDTDNLRARNLKAMVLRKLGQNGEAASLLLATLQLDPLDWWARHLNGEKPGATYRRCSTWRMITRAPGFVFEAIELLRGATPATN